MDDTIIGFKLKFYIMYYNMVFPYFVEQFQFGYRTPKIFGYFSKSLIVGPGMEKLMLYLHYWNNWIVLKYTREKLIPWSDFQMDKIGSSL